MGLCRRGKISQNIKVVSPKANSGTTCVTAKHCSKQGNGNLVESGKLSHARARTHIIYIGVCCQI